MLPGVKSPPRGHIGVVSIAHVHLAINVGSDPICGSLHTDEQWPQPFCGWVELAAAIEALRAAQPPGPDHRPRAEPAKA